MFTDKEVDMSVRAAIDILEHPKGLSFGCGKCSNIFAKGHLAIAITVSHGQYFLAPDEPVTCCGEQKYSFRVFSSMGEAKAVQQEVIAILKRDRTLDNVSLVEDIMG